MMQHMATTIETSPGVTPLGRTATVEIVVPVYNEERILEASIRRLRGYLDEQFPFDATVTIADNASTDGTWEVACRLAAQSRRRPGRAPRPEGPGSRPADRVVGERRRRGGLHGRRSGHRPRRPAAARRPAAVRPQRRRHRQPPGPWRPGGPGPEAGGHLPRSTTCMLRATMRNGFTDAQCGFKAMRGRRRPEPSSRWSPTRDGSSTPSCWFWPRPTGCGSTRCRWTGWTTRIPGWTWSPPPWATSGACSGWPAAWRPVTAEPRGRPAAGRRSRLAAPCRPAASPGSGD